MGLCLAVRVTSHEEPPRRVSASREIAASSDQIFELIADPANQPRWDGNDKPERGSRWPACPL